MTFPIKLNIDMSGSSGGAREARQHVSSYLNPDVLTVAGTVLVVGGIRKPFVSPVPSMEILPLDLEVDDSDEQAREWKLLQKALDEDRLSDRRLFP